jgi:hypothetical protein
MARASGTSAGRRPPSRSSAARSFGTSIADDETFAGGCNPSVGASAEYGRGGYGTYQSLLLMGAFSPDQSAAPDRLLIREAARHPTSRTQAARALDVF